MNLPNIPQILDSKGFSAPFGMSAEMCNPWPSPITARELCDSPPRTPEMLIDQMLYRGGTMLISGPSKAHKTYTMLDAAISIAGGTSWLNRATQQTPVIYLNLELQEFAVAKRVQGITRAKEIVAPRTLHFWNLRNIISTLGDIQRELPQKIREYEAGLVIIDPHYKVSAVSGAEENSNDNQAALLFHLEAICGESKAALMLAHHFAKGNAAGKNQIDRASGGGAFARWPDVFMTLTEHTEPEAMTMEFALRNFPPVAPFVARWDFPLWAIDDALDPAKLKRKGATIVFPATDALLKLSVDGMTYSQWRDATGWSESTFRRRLGELLRDKKIEKRGDRYYPNAAGSEGITSRPDSSFSLNSQDSQNRQNSSVTVAVATAEPTIQPPPSLEVAAVGDSSPKDATMGREKAADLAA